MPPKKTASAPKPKQGGYDALKERQERAKQTWRVSFKDTEISFVWRPYGVPIRIRGYVADVTGKTLDILLNGTTGVDVAQYVDMWWISRLIAGEAGADGRPISRIAVQEEFDQLCPGASLRDVIEEDISDEVHDSPEA